MFEAQRKKIKLVRDPREEHEEHMEISAWEKGRDHRKFMYKCV